MKGLTFLLAILINHSEGAMDIIIKNNNATIGVAVIITCTKSPSLVGSVSWLNDRYGTTTVISNCLHTIELCTPSISTLDDRYVFTSDIANKEFTMIITKVEQADEGVYTCKDSIEEGKATLQVVQPGKTEDGGYTKDELVKVGAGVGAGGTIGGLIIGGIIVFLCYNGCPGSWSDTVQQGVHQYIKFEVVLSLTIREEIMKETGANIFIRGNGSNKYNKTEGQGDHSLSGKDQPLQAYVTARFNIRVKKAVQRIKKIINEAIIKHFSVSIPQEDYPDIKFEKVLNHNTLKTVEKETGVKIIMYGEGSNKYGKYGLPLLLLNQPLQAFITSDNEETRWKAVEKIKSIIKDVTNTVLIPEDGYPGIQFEEELNPGVLQSVEKQTSTELRIYGKGHDKYRTNSEYLSDPYQVKPLHISIIHCLDNPDNIKSAYDQIKKIIQKAINKHKTLEKTVDPDHGSMMGRARLPKLDQRNDGQDHNLNGILHINLKSTKVAPFEKVLSQIKATTDKGFHV